MEAEKEDKAQMKNNHNRDVKGNDGLTLDPSSEGEISVKNEVDSDVDEYSSETSSE